MNAELDKKPEVAPKKAGGMDLSGMNLSSLMSAPEPSQEGSGPLRVLVDLISEDPSQPRGAENPGFFTDSAGIARYICISVTGTKSSPGK